VAAAPPATAVLLIMPEVAPIPLDLPRRGHPDIRLAGVRLAPVLMVVWIIGRRGRDTAGVQVGRWLCREEQREPDVGVGDDE
jgi:hypothetical protein